ncbi:AI-2E family transporter [Amphibacillus sp. Q70]|uniref:AI-2E family transporter n=1 Tax=Amphibacillus sp. Q70 TaxID=3453416 RepID=UPI003F87ACAD
MNNIKQIDKLIMKYLIIAMTAILLIANYEQVFSWLSVIWTVIRPVLMGGVIAYILNLLMVQFEKIYFPKKDNKWVQLTRRPVSIFFAMITIIFVIFFVVGLITPQLISVFITIVEATPVVFNMVQDWILEYEDIFPQIAAAVEEIDIDWQGIASNVLDFMNNFTGNVIEMTVSTVGSVFSFIVNLFLSLMIAIYVLLTKETLAKQFKRLTQTFLPKQTVKRLTYVSRVIDQSFSSFISGEVIEAVILGTMVAVGMWIFQFPYAGMVGALTGVTAFIPILGAYLSGAVGFILILVHSPVQAIGFIIFIIIVQQIEGNIFYPKVVGKSIGLPSLWVLVGVTIGGGLWGIWGMLLGVPIASALYRLLKDSVRAREKRKNSQ